MEKFYTYRIQIAEDKFPSGKKGYFVCVPELKHLGAYSQGHTKEEALANIQEALELVLEDLREEGKPIPRGARLVSKKPMVTVRA